MHETEQHAIDEIKTAYADAGPQRDNDTYVKSMRCLDFLTSKWLTPDAAAQAVEYIDSYNAFDAGNVADALEATAEADDSALIAVGREGSPVLYVETDDADAVTSIFESMDGRPNEIGQVDADGVGLARKRLSDSEGEKYNHTMCSHENPPVEPSDFPETDPARAYVRAWWD